MVTGATETDRMITTIPGVQAEGQPVPAVPMADAGLPSIPRPRVRSRAFWNDVRDTLVMVIVIYTLVNLIAPRYIVEGASMQPNFETGEWIIVSRLPYLFGEPQRGDVVVLDFDEPQDDLIKRVIGLPGETVEVRDNTVYINGVPLAEDYINAEPRYTVEPVTLAQNEYYVLGDNRNNSRDSHSFGAVTTDHVMGQAWLIYWPPPNWGIVPQQTYAETPPVP